METVDRKGKQDRAMGSDEIMIFSMQPDEACLVEQCVHAREEQIESKLEHYPLMLRIGECMASNKERQLEVTEDDLWWLRKVIDLKLKYGQTNGVALVSKVFKAIADFHPELACKLPNAFEQNAMAEEVEYADRSTDQSTGEGTGESTSDGSGSQAES